MDIIKIGRIGSSIVEVSSIYEDDKLLVERLFCESDTYVLRVTRKINNTCRAVYYMSFNDIISMFACIDFISNPNAV